MRRCCSSKLRNESKRSIESLIKAAVERHEPPLYQLKRPKIYYATQVSEAPPAIVLVCNQPQGFTAPYQRYLLGFLRDHLPFGEIPIKLYLQPRARDDQRDEIGDTTSSKNLLPVVDESDDDSYEEEFEDSYEDDFASEVEGEVDGEFEGELEGDLESEDEELAEGFDDDAESAEADLDVVDDADLDLADESDDESEYEDIELDSSDEDDSSSGNASTRTSK